MQCLPIRLSLPTGVLIKQAFAYSRETGPRRKRTDANTEHVTAIYLCGRILNAKNRSKAIPEMIGSRAEPAYAVEVL